jgi:hypothetical protein
MTGLCLLKCFKANAGILIPIIICSFGLIKCIHATSVEAEDVEVKKLPFCDENLATKRADARR